MELINLTPGGSLRFELPRVSLGFTTRFSTGEVVRHRSVYTRSSLSRTYHPGLTRLSHPPALSLQSAEIARDGDYSKTSFRVGGWTTTCVGGRLKCWNTQAQLWQSWVWALERPSA